MAAGRHPPIRVVGPRKTTFPRPFWVSGKRRRACSALSKRWSPYPSDHKPRGVVEETRLRGKRQLLALRKSWQKQHNLFPPPVITIFVEILEYINKNSGQIGNEHGGNPFASLTSPRSYISPSKIFVELVVETPKVLELNPDVKASLLRARLYWMRIYQCSVIEV